MPETESALIKALKSKLNKLLKVVLDEATVNSEFREKLEGVLLEPKPAAVAKKPAAKARKTKEKFNPVSFLQENGREALTATLSLKTDTELKAILRAEGIKKPKELKTIERQQMIDEIVQDAARRLGHGDVFLKK